jgi:histone H3/H4
MSSTDTDAEDEADKDLPDGDHQIVKTSVLRDKLREDYDPQVSDEGHQELIYKLDILSDKIWTQAVRVADRDDRGTVKQRDVEEAYQQLLRPYNAIYDAISRLETAERELEAVAENSPFAPGEGKND